MKLETMLTIQPDIKFKRELIKLSNSSLNACMQCGNCSVVCSLAPDDNPFPRQEMIWAGWGIKEPLLSSKNAWLCHQCGDCSEHCPRDVKPADVMSAVRQLQYQHYARPKFMANMLNKPQWLPIAVFIPVLIISGILALAGTFQIPKGPVNYASFFPHAWLNVSFSLITFVFYSLAIYSITLFWESAKKQIASPPQFGVLKGAWLSLKEILMHERFGNCNSPNQKKWPHLLVLYGFILLLLVTIFAIVAAITHHYPIAFWHPVKILGNMAGIMLISGLLIMIIERLVNKRGLNSNYADWLLLTSLLLLTFSGIIVELARLQNWNLAYHFYFFHLMCVWFVIMYLPFTKFSHIMYRVTAMSLEKATSKSREIKNNN